MVSAAAATRTMTGLWPWAAVIVVLALPGAFAATTHVVGDGTGWTRPSSTSFYATWASRQTFAVGDTLQFNFVTGAHDLIKVPKSSYDGCTAQNQIGDTVTTGPASVNLTSTGVHYYICSFGTHCLDGQKVAITVASSDGTTTPSSPPTSGGPVTPPTPSSPPTSGAPGSRVAVGFALAVGSSLLWIL